jgi:hypothetical protein
MVEGDTKETVAARLKVQLTIAEWDSIKRRNNHRGSHTHQRKKRGVIGIPLHTALAVTTIREREK